MNRFIALFLILFSSVTLYSQSLVNTTWIVYDQSNVFFNFFHFSSSVISYSSNNVSYTNVSNYSVAGNNITVTDITNGACSTSDIGHYTYLINVDTLKFTLISDPCFSRPPVFDSYKWVRIPAGIDDIDPSKLFTIYPNPASEVLSINSKSILPGCSYFITDISGKQVLTGNLTGELTGVEIKKLEPGIYFLHLGLKREYVQKFIKE